MEKGIIYIREPHKWLTNIADEIIKTYQPAEVVYFNAGEIVPNRLSFCWERCNEHTKLLVIDNVYASLQLHELAFMQNEGKLVNRKHSPPFSINPRMVLICDNHLSPEELLQSESLKMRFDIIYCSESNKPTTIVPMKPSALRQHAFIDGKTILRVRHKLDSSLNVYYIIVSYNGFGWQNWQKTSFYKTPEQAEKDIEKAVENHPEKYVNDKVYQPQ